MYQTKAATQSVDISADVADVPANLGNAIDAGMILVAQATALYGRLRANKMITSVFAPKT